MRADGRTKVKQKRRKKDLEELHPNVLEEKKKLHRKTSWDPKWKTAFAKVLSNFADQRQQNEDTIHEKNGRKANPRTICSRLLPEPTVGMYKNGAKGRQARRAGGYMNETLNARLEGNVFKLLNGDETNPNSSGNSQAKCTKKMEQACSGKTTESDSPVLGKTKGDKWINTDTEKNVAGQEVRVKPRDQQRKNMCKKRLFEPDDENASDEHSFQNINSLKIMDDICFSSTGRMDVCNSESDNSVKNYSTLNEDGGREKCKGTLDLEKSTKTFWDWSPSIHYESFRTKFYSKILSSRVQCIGQDPMIKIRENLRKLYAPTNCRMEIIAREMSEYSQLTAASKSQHSLSDNPTVSSLTGTENGTSDLELDQESSDSWMIKVGSWHSSTCNGVSSENDASIHDPMKSKKSRVKESKDFDVQKELKEKDPQRITKKNRVSVENSLKDGVERTINSVSLFLKTLRDNNPTNGQKGRKTFAAEVAAAAELCRVKEKSNNYFDKPHDSGNNINTKRVVRKNTKHVPTILRRSNSRSSLAKRINHKFQDTRRRSEKRGYACSDSTFTEYPRYSTGSSSSSIARVDDSDLVETPSIASPALSAESENVTKLNLTRRKSKHLENKIERHVSCDGSTDVESSDDTSRTDLPVGRYVEKDHARKVRTRVAQSRGIRQRRVTFDVDGGPSHFQQSKRSEQSPDLHPAPNNYEPLAPYHGDPRSEPNRNFSRQENDVKIAPQELHARLVAGVAEIDRRSQNQNFEASNLPTFHDENLSSDRFINEPEYARPAPREQPIRKPVVLFKPIQTIGNDRQSYQPCNELLNKTFTTVSDAVRNVNVHSYAEDPRDLTQQRQTAPVRQNCCLEHQHQRYPDQASTRTICNNPGIPINQNVIRRESLSQPAKFLALQQGDGDPQRIPICAYVDRPRVVAPAPLGHRQDSSGIVVYDNRNNGELACTKCQQLHHHHCNHQVEPAYICSSSVLGHPSNSFAIVSCPFKPSGTADRGTGTFGMRQQSQSLIPCADHQSQHNTAQFNNSTGFNSGFLANSRVQLANGKIGTFIPDNHSAFGMGQQNRHDISRGATELSFVGPRSSSFFQQHASNNVAVATAPRNVCSVADCEQVAASQLQGKPQYSVANFNGCFNEHEALPNRVQLADGTIGVFVPESRSVGNTVFLNDDQRSFNTIRTDETGYGQDLYVSGSQACRCNPVLQFRH